MNKKQDVFTAMNVEGPTEMELQKIFYEFLKEKGLKFSSINQGDEATEYDLLLDLSYITKWFKDNTGYLVTNLQIAKFLDIIGVQGNTNWGDWCYGVSLINGYSSFASIEPYYKAQQRSISPEDIGRNTNLELLEVFINYLQDLVKTAKK